MKYAGETITGSSPLYNATGNLSSRPTCIGLQANVFFFINLYLLKSVPIVFATEGINSLSILIPRTSEVTNDLFRSSMSSTMSPSFL